MKAEESHLSKKNRLYRDTHRGMNALLKESYERDQDPYAEVSVPSAGRQEDERLLFDNRDKRTIDVWLKGPDHPLLYKVSAVHRVGTGKEAIVEQDSVNSVLLERFPNDDHDQWLVAAHVGMSQSGNALLLRNTTFLPNQVSRCPKKTF